MPKTEKHCVFFPPAPTRSFAPTGLPHADIEIYENGDTALHRFLRYGKDASLLTQFIKKMGKKRVQAMTTIYNNEGKLPIDFVMDPDSSWIQTSPLIITLINLTVTQTYKPLREPIDQTEILDRYQPTTESNLFQNLTLACFIVNEVRAIIEKSITHPESNRRPQAENDAIFARIKRMRENDKAYETDDGAFLRHATKQIMTEKIGNCSEFAYLAYSFLRQKDSYIKAALYSIKEGDHVVLAFGMTNYSNNYLLWGDDTVICDAWVGDVYPAYEIEWRLGDCAELELNGKEYQLLTHFNPKCQSLELFFPSKPTEFPNKFNRYAVSAAVLGSAGLFAAYGAYQALTQADASFLASFTK